MSKLPVVYVRGYAGTTSGIDAQVEDPFYGFNLGSTHVRVGGSGEPLFHQFESPLLRLILDEDYHLLVQGSQADYLSRQPDGRVPPDSIWIHRYYDVSASTWGEKPQAFRLERAAEDLLELIELLQRKTGAPRVHLVAHSMGGLICRSLIQKIIPDQRPGRHATDYVARLFTYGTPHGGIQFDVGFGLFERLRDTFGIAGAEVFGPRRMYEYLTPARDTAPKGPPKGWSPLDVPDHVFPNERIFCLVGTNPDDYGAAFGLSSKAVGAKSDGLVQIENAYLPGARHGFVHRSHSGRYGLVNSEEGYQNLRRFLFGDLAVQADLLHLKLPHDDPEVVWQAETRLSVRGLPIAMHEQLAAHHCPIQLGQPEVAGTADRPVPLVTTYLSSRASRPTETMRYILQVRILSLRQRRGAFQFFDHLEQAADFDDVLVVDVGHLDHGFSAWVVWSSELPVPLRDYVPQGPPLTDEDPELGSWVATVPLPERARRFLGDHAAVRLSVSDRTVF
ncbi:esterase/lipase family protein [Egicoccus sp. AB-alg2]|uniref:esterase/lipase family protein n=1 Tax=Egicoccus sp. AB-alg2 TaxID=3242693 RepID=UPI00359DC14A